MTALKNPLERLGCFSTLRDGFLRSSEEIETAAGYACGGFWLI
jgi:hypothetical protein